MTIYSIYKWTNQINGKVYIGQTKNPEKRRGDHIAYAANGSDNLIHRAIRKYGLENFSFEVIFNVLDSQHLDEMEREFIRNENSYCNDSNNNGYNMTRGGNGMDSNTARLIALKRVAEGTHPWVGEKGSKRNTERNLAQVAAGTHPFSGTAGSKLATERNLAIRDKISQRAKDRVANGTHHLAGEQGKLRHQKQLESGTHSSQVVRTCPHCGLIGRGNNMLRFHLDKCKRKEGH